MEFTFSGWGSRGGNWWLVCPHRVPLTFWLRFLRVSGTPALFSLIYFVFGFLGFGVFCIRFSVYKHGALELLQGTFPFFVITASTGNLSQAG